MTEILNASGFYFEKVSAELLTALKTRGFEMRVSFTKNYEKYADYKYLVLVDNEIVPCEDRHLHLYKAKKAYLVDGKFYTDESYQREPFPSYGQYGWIMFDLPDWWPDKKIDRFVHLRPATAVTSREYHVFKTMYENSKEVKVIWEGTKKTRHQALLNRYSMAIENGYNVKLVGDKHMFGMNRLADFQLIRELDENIDYSIKYYRINWGSVSIDAFDVSEIREER